MLMGEVRLSPTVQLSLKLVEPHYSQNNNQADNVPQTLKCFINIRQGTHMTWVNVFAYLGL
jgi:hypothetical protein